MSLEVANTAASPLLELIPAARRAVLVALKCHGSATVEDLATFCNLPSGATRQPLTVMRAQGFVRRTSERVGVGRPRDRYWLTPRGELLFAGSSGFVVDRFLGALDGEPAEIRSRLLARVMGEVAAGAAAPARETGAEVSALANIA